LRDLGFVHKFVPAVGGSRLTLLLLHGTGGNESDLIQLGRQLSPGAALLSPRGKVLENGMPRFFRRLGEGIFDINDLTDQTHNLALFAKEASKEYGFALGKVVAVGFSNGANIAGSTLILHPETLAGAVLIRPMIPFVPENVPKLSGKPILILAGTRDALVPRQETERLADLLRRSGADVTLNWADAGHGITGEEVAIGKDWLSSKFPDR
jgi:predicted esterase